MHGVRRFHGNTFNFKIIEFIHDNKYRLNAAAVVPNRNQRRLISIDLHTICKAILGSTVNRIGKIRTKESKIIIYVPPDWSSFLTETISQSISQLIALEWYDFDAVQNQVIRNSMHLPWHKLNFTIKFL